MPATDICSHSLLTIEHPILHNPVNLDVTDMGFPFLADVKSILTNELVFRMIYKFSFLVDNPGVTSLALADVSSYIDEKFSNIQFGEKHPCRCPFKGKRRAEDRGYS